jgi:spectinomycin phosphotransferase
MLEDPGIDSDAVRTTLRAAYGIDASVLNFVPGYDPHAASYEVTASARRFFLKVRFDAVREASLDVPASLLEAGVPNVLAPIHTRSSELWARMEDRSLMLYSFVRGRSAMDAGLTEGQWRTFGASLRAVHDSGLEQEFADRLPVDRFGLPASRSVHRMLEVAARQDFESTGARRLAELLFEPGATHRCHARARR